MFSFCSKSKRKCDEKKNDEDTEHKLSSKGRMSNEKENRFDRRSLVTNNGFFFLSYCKKTWFSHQLILMSVNVNDLGFSIQINHEMSFKCEYTQNE